MSAGKGERIPAAVERVLAAELLPEAEFLQERFDNAYTRKWLDRARLASGEASVTLELAG